MPQLLAANKMDLPQAPGQFTPLRAKLEPDYEIFPSSAVTGEGIDGLLFRVSQLLAELPEKEEKLAEPRNKFSGNLLLNLTLSVVGTYNQRQGSGTGSCHDQF